MTDIVERLRREAVRFAAMDLAAERPWVADAAWASSALHAAADEIERLKAEIVLLEATGAEAADEIERLRADLLKAEMRVEIAGLENIMRAVAKGRREGIEALAAKFERMTDHATAALVRSVGAALLEDEL